MATLQPRGHSHGAQTAGDVAKMTGSLVPSGAAGSSEAGLVSCPVVAGVSSPQGPLPPLLQLGQPLLPGLCVLGPHPVGHLCGCDVDLCIAGGASP